MMDGSAPRETELNLLRRDDFERVFAVERPTAFLAEQVWEHITFEEDCLTAGMCVRLCRIKTFATNGIRIWLR